MTRRERFFVAWAHGIVRHHRAILWGALLATLLSLGAATRLEMRAGRIDLLGEHDPVAQAWLGFAADFGSPNGIVLMVEGADAAARRHAVQVIVDRLEPRRADLYRGITFKLDEEFVQRYGPYYADGAAVAEVADTLDLLPRREQGASWADVLARLERNIGRELPELSSDATGVQQLQRLARFFDRWAEALETAHISGTGWLESDIGTHMNDGTAVPVDSEGYLVSNDGAYHLVLIDPRAEREDDAAFLLPFMRTIQAGIAQAEREIPGTQVSMTGMSAYAFSDLRVMQRELPWLTALGLVAVVVIFRSVFHSLRPALEAGLCLLMAVVWTMGLTALTVGHLTLLSSVFGLILIGLGIDYGIHLLARYQDERRTQAPEAALGAAYRHGVNGILTGGITTAAAFALCSVADFVAFAELGQITAIGIACSLLAMLTVLPALILRRDTGESGVGPSVPGPTANPGAFERTGDWLQAHAWIGLAVAIGLVIWVWPRAGHVEFDHNFLHMQPSDTPYPQAEAQLEDTTDLAPQFNLILVGTAAEETALAARLAALPTVRRVTHAEQFLPQVTRERQADLNRLRAQAVTARVPPAPGPDELDRIDTVLDRVRFRFAAYERTSFAVPDKGLMEQVARVLRAVVRVRAQREALGREAWVERQQAFFGALQTDMAAVLDGLRDMAPEPPHVADLPADLRSRFVGASGQRALYVIPRESLWDRPFLLQFNTDVASVAPTFTGMGSLLAHLIGQAAAAPQQVDLWVAGVIVVVLALDFRHAGTVIAACASLVLGVTVMLAVMSTTGVAFTPMNVLALPLLLGIGIDNSVHVLHRLRAEGDVTLGQMMATTGRAVFLASATTLVGFGLLGLSSHRGLRGFGVVMVIGVVACYAVAVVVLPCVWCLAHRMRRAGPHD